MFFRSAVMKSSPVNDTVGQWKMLIRKPVSEINSNPFILNLQNGLFKRSARFCHGMFDTFSLPSKISCTTLSRVDLPALGAPTKTKDFCALLLDAGTFIEYELREHFRLKTTDAKALAAYHKELYKVHVPSAMRGQAKPFSAMALQVIGLVPLFKKCFPPDTERACGPF